MSAPSVVAPSARGPTPVGTRRGIRDARAAQVGDFDGCRFKLVCALRANGHEEGHNPSWQRWEEVKPRLSKVLPKKVMKEIGPPQ